MAYSDKVLDHYDNPRNVGKMNADDAARRSPRRWTRASRTGAGRAAHCAGLRSDRLDGPGDPVGRPRRRRHIVCRRKL